MKQKTTEWMTGAELAGRLDVTLKTVRKRSGKTLGGLRYEARAVNKDDQVHWRTKTLYRAIPVSSRRPGRTASATAPRPEKSAPLEPLPDRDLPGQLRWSEGRREELHNRATEQRRQIAQLEQRVYELEQDYGEAVQEKAAALQSGETGKFVGLFEAVMSALGGVDVDDMREILSQAIRDHMDPASAI